jgi:hypothetical protein
VRGQASIEVVGLLPMIAAVGLIVAHLLAAAAATEFAGNAAEAGAIALSRDGDPARAARAARAAVPGWSRDRLSIRVDGRRVRVRLRPLAAHGKLSDLLTATESADAGPANAPSAPPSIVEDDAGRGPETER